MFYSLVGRRMGGGGGWLLTAVPQATLLDRLMFDESITLGQPDSPIYRF